MVVTVSGFSKREIEKYYPRTKGKVSVVPNAWQHINRTEPDDSVINRFGLTSGSYFFAMSSLAPNKNLWWIAETARLNPNEIFAVAGGMNSRVFGRHGIPEADNVRYLGYVTDEEAKTLMQSCKAFLYPTIYEGFGIPPMEALACGARIVISDTEVMHEVYGDTATYVDPSVPVTDIGRVVSATKVDGTSVLNSYSWTDSASKLLNLLRVF